VSCNFRVSKWVPNYLPITRLSPLSPGLEIPYEKGNYSPTSNHFSGAILQLTPEGLEVVRGTVAQVVDGSEPTSLIAIILIVPHIGRQLRVRRAVKFVHKVAASFLFGDATKAVVPDDGR
jgi:hypothetical protein